MAGGMALPSPYPIKLVDYTDENEDLLPVEHPDDENSDDVVSNPESEGSPPPTNTLLSPPPIPVNPSEPMTLRRTTSSFLLTALGGRNHPRIAQNPRQLRRCLRARLCAPEPTPSATVGLPTPSTPPPSMESSPTMLTISTGPEAAGGGGGSEDDEVLGLLATKSKRQSPGVTKKRKTTAAAEAGAKPAAVATAPSPTGGIESKEKDSTMTKKIKLSLGKTAFGIASSMITTPPLITADAPGKQQGDGG